MKRPIVYIAGPLSGSDGEPDERKVDDAIAIAELVYACGGLPFVPHLFVRWDSQEPKTYEHWIAMCLFWVEKCDLFIRIPGKSKGADREMEYWLNDRDQSTLMICTSEAPTPEELIEFIRGAL